MIVTDKTRFEGNEFAIQIIARGFFVDDGCGSEKTYIVETFAIRLNHIALNEWLLTKTSSCRECYDDGPDGDKEWENHKTEYATRHEAIKKQLIEDLGIDPDKGSVAITQSHAEMFAAVYIRATSGLKILPVNGPEFEVSGTVTYKDFDEDGRIYYCAGRSFPEEIVTAVI